MQKKVLRYIEKHHMFPKGASVIVGISGGADSVALLHLLHLFAEERDWSLTAVHIHHGIRGKDADTDQSFVETLCKEWDVPCIVRSYDVPQEAVRLGMSEEEAGRKLRYDAFRQLAGKDGFIAVAHHEKDQAETLLMRLCRGTGLTGLVGMRPVSGRLCRPLLCCSREEIERYCKNEGLSYRDDKTNFEDTYTRNKLRLRVLPILEDINPQSTAHIARTAELLRADEALLSELAEKAFLEVSLPTEQGSVLLERNRLNALHPALRRRVLRKALSVFFTSDISLKETEALEALLQKPTGKTVTLPRGILAQTVYDTLLLSRKKEEAQKGFCYPLPKEGEVFIREAGVSVFLEKNPPQISEIERDACTKLFDCDKIEGNLFCRTRQTGDHISLKNGRKKIKALLIDEKIPREQRDALPLITAEGHEILWAAGLRVSGNFRPDEHTKNILRITIRRVKE